MLTTDIVLLVKMVLVARHADNMTVIKLKFAK